MTKDTTISVVEGDEIQFKGNNSRYSYYDDDESEYIGNNLASTVECNVYGNIMSLTNGDNFKIANTINEYAFRYLFCDYWEEDESFPVVNAKNLKLPATTLASYCYGYMFKDCTSLTTAPTLPATTLAEDCYGSMFYGCTNLTTAPALPATTLVGGYCYYHMFYGCTSLTTAPELPATTLTQSCYESMFMNCSSLTSAPELPATTLNRSCYYQMFRGCTNLTTAPVLPATTLASNCYTSMFSGCSRLNYIKCLATNISDTSCTSNWVKGVASTGTFVKNPNMTSWAIGETYNEDDDEYYVNGIPSGWTVVDAE